jgi:hypothetical protein
MAVKRRCIAFSWRHLTGYQRTINGYLILKMNSAQQHNQPPFTRKSVFLVTRFLLLAAAALPFGCLLADLYGIRMMHHLGLFLIPSGIGLLLFAGYHRSSKAWLEKPSTWVVHGTIAGLLATAVYDIFRVPFALSGIPLFRPINRFGEMLLAQGEAEWKISLFGWSFHFLNGACLGVMFFAILSLCSGRKPMVVALLWLTVVEGILLTVPYAKYFNIELSAQFAGISEAAHLAFGATLGFYAKKCIGSNGSQ